MPLFTVFACLCLVIPAGVSAQSDYSVACYVDVSTQRLFHHISPSICTHVISSSAYLGDDSSFKTTSQDGDTGCTSLKKLKERNPSLKTLLGVEVKQSRLEILTQNQANLDNFIDSTLKYLKEKNYYDGLELTWVEKTASDEPLKTTETLRNLLKELKGWIEEDADLYNKSILVSVTLPDHSDQISTHSGAETLSQYVDFISVLPANLKDEPEMERAVKYWQEQGVEPKKLVLALPAFLRRSRRRAHGRHPETVDLNPEKVEQPYGPGLMIAKQVCQAIKSGQTELKIITQLESAQTLREEVSWLLQKGFGGVGVVVLDIGNFVNTICLNCTETENAILESKVISGSPHHPHSHSHGPRSGHGHHHGHHHHHHHDRDGRASHSHVQSSRDDQSFDSNDTGYRRGPHHHGHFHRGHGQHGHFHRGHGHHGHGHHGRGQHGDPEHEGRSHHDHHSSA
ncbi:histidine-rich carboxyl terminus protein 1 isoform X1 [Pygocentrus nattereri]|uniref:GH18 domain-containing protein n=1 Tax=Pygocentrus nattereri TaxID=42514 RepID=A0A3B4CYQ3_PYGNA|nr:histidine-rich carboxyl terminus protein 1 isoform X1 [Pygocentrus nattereri]